MTYTYTLPCICGQRPAMFAFYVTFFGRTARVLVSRLAVEKHERNNSTVRASRLAGGLIAYFDHYMSEFIEIAMNKAPFVKTVITITSDDV